MSFFKKLFNRITGTSSEPPEAAAPPPSPPEVQEASPPAQPEPEIAVPLPPDAETPALPQKLEIPAEPPAKPARKKAVRAAKARDQRSPKGEPRQPPAAVATAKKEVAPDPAIEEPAEEPAPLPATAVNETPAAVRRSGWLSRLSEGLSKSSRSITGSITSIFTKRRLDAGTLQDLEDVLIQADLGVAVSGRIVKAVAAGRYDKEIDPEDVRRVLAAEVAKVLKPVEVPFSFGSEKPFVILVVGVNGSGKTTTIGKLGAIASGEGYKVMFAACDTFRAAAIEQLVVWGSRVKARTLTAPQGSDASGLAFDAMREAKQDGTDILFIDTAGRLHNKAYLMDELDKVVRVIKKQDETAPHAVLLVLDATTGQNAMAQAEAFTKVAGVTGIIMTKLDGTARGGILVAIAEAFKLPVHAIGVGESIEDLQPFDAEAFAQAIAGLEAA